jgi:hypothetical protein
MPKSFALDSSTMTRIKKRNVIRNTIVNIVGNVDTEDTKNGVTQIANTQLGYESAGPIYFQRGPNLIA